MFKCFGTAVGEGCEEAAKEGLDGLNNNVEMSFKLETV